MNSLKVISLKYYLFLCNHNDIIFLTSELKTFNLKAEINCMEGSLELNFVFHKVGKHGSALTIHELIWAWFSWGNFSLSESFQLHY